MGKLLFTDFTDTAPLWRNCAEGADAGTIAAIA
jgi:hypothetical protein